jgi:peptidoglycan hydrolase-like protein with peptidoglycan-binding domain
LTLLPNLSAYGAALDVARIATLKNTSSTTQLGALFSQLNKQQILNVASTSGLTEATLNAALARSTLSDETANEILELYRDVQAKAANTVATEAATASTGKFTGAVKGLWATLKASPLLKIALALGAIVAVGKICEAYFGRFENQLASLREEYNNLGSEITSIQSELETTGARIKELQNLDAPTLADEDELRKLQQQNDALETQLKLKQDQQKEKQQGMASNFVGAMEQQQHGVRFAGVSQQGVVNTVAEDEAVARIIAAKQAIAKQGKDIDKDELAHQKTVIANERKYLEERLAIYEGLAEGVEYGQSPESDAMLDYINDLRIALLALSDSSTSAVSALRAIFADARYNGGVSQIKSLLADSEDDVDAFSASLKEAYDAAGKDSSLVQLIDRLQELGYFSWDNIDGLANTFRALADSASSAADAVGEVYDLASAIEALSDKYELLKKAQEEFSESGSLSIDTLNSIKEKFPALSDAIDEYLMGLKSTKELLNEMAVVYQTDENNYRRQLVAKAQASTEFFNQNSKDLKQQIDNLAEGYGVDLGNYQTVEKAKLEFSQKIIQKLAEAWGRYFGLTAKNIDSAALQMSSRLNSIAQQYGKNSAEYQNAYKEAKDLSNAAAAMRDFSSALDDMTVSKINFNPSTFYNKSSSGGSSKSSSSKTKSMEELYKELTDLQTNITRADDRLEKKAEDTTEEQIALWLKLRKAAVAELAKIKDHTSEAYRYVEDILKTANEHLDSLYSQQLDSISDVIDMTKDMIKQEVEDQCDALDKQAEKYRELVEIKRKLLEDTQKESDYEDDIAEKVKAISDLQTRIAQLQLEINANPNDSRAAQAEQRKLQEELAKLQKELQDAQDEHYRDSLDARLDEEAEAFEKQKEDEIEKLKETIDSEAKLYEKAIERINDQWGDLYRQLLEYNRKYGTGIDSDITKAWEVAKDAVDKYGGSIEDVIAKIKSMQGGIQSATANGSYNQVNGDGTGFEGAGSGGAGNGSGGASGNGSAYQRAVQKFGSAPSGKPNLQIGSKGKQVQWLQYYLDQAVNGGSGALPADGTFYTRTRDTLKAFQKMAGVTADGIFGPNTASKLKKYHTGGRGGRDLGLKEREQLAILKDEEWVATGKQFRNVKGLLDAVAQIKKSLPRIQPLPVRPTPAIAGAGGNVFETNVDVRIEHHGDFDDKAAAKFADLVANRATKKLNDVMARQGVRK